MSEKLQLVYRDKLLWGRVETSQPAARVACPVQAGCYRTTAGRSQACITTQQAQQRFLAGPVSADWNIFKATCSEEVSKSEY